MNTFMMPLLAALALSSGVALAADQPARGAVQAACKADVEKLCPGTQPGGGRIGECLKKNEAQVSPTCKDAIAKAHQHKSPAATGSTQG